MQIEAVERQVTRTVTDTEKVVSIELTEDEAIAVLAVFGGIGGHNETSNVRFVTDKIYAGLRDTFGIPYSDYRVKQYQRFLTPARVTDVARDDTGC